MCSTWTGRTFPYNKDIINAVNQKYGDFTGHLDRNPRVTFVNDEARRYIARSPEKFDIIQVSQSKMSRAIFLEALLQVWRLRFRGR